MIGIGFSEIIIVLILLAVIGAAFVAALRALGGGSQSVGRGHDARRILDERYARGELARDEYERMRRDMEAG